MSNPYSRPQSGYLPLILKGFENLGMTNEFKLFTEVKVKLGITSSFTGNVKVISELKQPCIKALETLGDNEGAKYYIHGLTHGDFSVCSTDGAFVYNPNDAKAVAFVKEMTEGEKNWKSGELYFKS